MGTDNAAHRRGQHQTVAENLFIIRFPAGIHPINCQSRQRKKCLRRIFPDGCAFINVQDPVGGRRIKQRQHDPALFAAEDPAERKVRNQNRQKIDAERIDLISRVDRKSKQPQQGREIQKDIVVINRKGIAEPVMADQRDPRRELSRAECLDDCLDPQVVYFQIIRILMSAECQRQRDEQRDPCESKDHPPLL